MKENEIKIVTTVHLDLIDQIKVLFGRKIIVNQTIVNQTIVNQTIELMNIKVEGCNTYSNVEIVSSSKYKHFQDKPEFGFTHNPEPDNDDNPIHEAMSEHSEHCPICQSWKKDSN